MSEKLDSFLHLFLCIYFLYKKCQHVLAQTGGGPADLFPMGWCVELQDSVDPGVAWGAQVEDNIGGRLCLRYAGTEGLTQSLARRWVFYLDPLLHPPGWAEENSCSLTPPAGKEQNCLCIL